MTSIVVFGLQLDYKQIRKFRELSYFTRGKCPSKDLSVTSRLLFTRIHV